VGQACVAHLSFCFEKTLYWTFHKCFLPNVGSFGYSVSEMIFFLEITRKNNCLWWPCLLTDRNEMSNLYRGPYIDASYQVLVHLAKLFQRRLLRNRPIRNKNCLWWPCLLTNQDEMRNLNRGPSIDALYQVSIHLTKRFQKKRFIEINQSETRISCGGHVC
jgi:hypothetical protein